MDRTSSRILAVSAVGHPGGAETTLMRLLHGLAARGWAVTVSAPVEGLISQEAISAGYRFERVLLGGLPRRTGARAVLSWPTLRRLAAADDVLYLNGAVCGRLLPALSGMRRRPRVVLHVHDMVRRVPGMWRRADVVLAASQAVADRLEMLDPVVVYAPVDPDPPPARPPWPAGEGPVIGFVGRVERRKGPMDLVRAAPAIRRGAPAARVVLVGEDPYQSDPEYTAAVLSSPEIEHYPWVVNGPGLIRHLDVLVLPSYEEPFGTVLAEAMAVGTPVVATRVDGLPEVVDDGVTGRLVPPGQPDELAAAVLEVLARRDEMGPAARRHAQRFATEDYVERVLGLIAA